MSIQPNSRFLQLPVELRDRIYAFVLADDVTDDVLEYQDPFGNLPLRRTCHQVHDEIQNCIPHLHFSFTEDWQVRVLHTCLPPPKFRLIKRLSLITSLATHKDDPKSCTWSALIILNSVTGLNLDILRITPEWRLRGADDYLGIVDMIQRGCGWKKLVVTLTYWAVLQCDIDDGRVRKPDDESTYDRSPIPSHLHKLLLQRDGEDSGAEVVVRRALDDLPSTGYDDFFRLCQAATYDKEKVGLTYHNRDLPFREQFDDVQLRYEQQAPSWACFRHLEIIVKRGRKAQIVLEEDGLDSTPQFRPTCEEWKRVNPWGAGR